MTKQVSNATRCLSVAKYLRLAVWLFLFLVAGFSARAHDFAALNGDGDSVYYNITSYSPATVSVTYRGDYSYSYSNEYSEIVNIPASVTHNGTTYSVTSIGAAAFYDCYDLIYVTLPNTVTSIGERAFYECYDLTSITIPASVASIGAAAFYWCTALTSVVIPQNSAITAIPGSLFYECDGLVSVTIPSTVTSIGNYSFYGCRSLSSITIPTSVTSIGSYAFSDCNSLSSVTIPTSVTSIGSSAFSDCYSLTSVTIPTSITSIGSSVFSDCRSLSSVTIPTSVTSIGSYAFSYCSSLTSVTIPTSVTSIGSSAFSDCNSLTSVTIPTSISSIEDGTFSGCSGLTSVTIPSSVVLIKSSAFANCSSLDSVTIPSSVVLIGSRAFAYCRSLTTVTIPSSITSIGNNAFNQVPNIEYHGFASGAPWGAYSMNGYVEGYLVYSDSTKTHLIKCSRAAKNVTLPNTVATIGEEAFCNCDSLTAITIPSSVTTIGSRAFAYCDNLDSVTIESACELPYNIFENSGTIEHLFITSNIPPAISGDNTLYSIYSYETTIHVPCAAIDTYRNHAQWGNYSNYRGLRVDIPVSQEACGSFIGPDGTTYTSDTVVAYSISNSICDSMMVLTLNIFPTYQQTEAVSLCNDMLPFSYGDTLLTATGQYTFEYTTAHDCDSIVTLALTVHATYQRNDSVSLCDDMLPYSYGNQMLSTAGVHTVAFSSTNGCDSVITLNLAIHPTYRHSDAVAVCSSLLPYTYGDSVLTAAGVYTVNMSSENRCDSVVTLSLSVAPSYQSTEALSLCDNLLPYQYGDTLLSAAGVHTIGFTAMNNCDSVVMLALSVKPTYQRSEAVTLCDDMLPYHYGDSVLTTPGVYPTAFTAGNNCDSVVTLTLSVNPTYRHYDTVALCDNMLPYSYGGMSLTAAGEYTVDFISANHCDSVVTLALSVNPSYQQNESLTLCDNMLPYSYGDTVLTSAGMHTVGFTSMNHCDSVVLVLLSLKAAYQHADAVSLCEDMLPYSYGDTVLTSAGEHDIVFTAENDCDSVVTLTLTANATYQHTAALTVCDNMFPYSYGDTVLNEAGWHTVDFSSMYGCDSVVTLALAISPTYQGTDYMELCQSGLPITYGDTVFDETTVSGNYAVTMSSQAGCDSTIVLGLTVHSSEETALQMVTVENNLCKVMWEKQAAVASYNIYRERIDDNTYDLVHTAPFSDTSCWADSTTSPKYVSYRYKIASVDSCGVESPWSEPHASLRLTIAEGMDNSYDLQWNPYEGAPCTSYKIYRGATEQQLELIDSVSAGSVTYNDGEAPSADVLYIVAAVLGESEEVRSNTISPAEIGLDDLAGVDRDWQVRAEKGILEVQGAEGETLHIYDTYGRLLKQIARARATERYAVPAAGLYIVKMQSGVSKKITVLK